VGIISGTSVVCSCEIVSGGYQVSATYTFRSTPENSVYLGVWTEPNNVEYYCNSQAAFYSPIDVEANSFITPSDLPLLGGEQYECVLYDSYGDSTEGCGSSYAKYKFSCPNPKPSSKSLGSLFTIFIPSILFFLFFLAVIIRVIRRSYYNSYQNTEDEEDQQPVVTSIHTGNPQDYEMSNMTPPGVYPVMQMTNPNGQMVYIPQFSVPPSQMYTNSMPNVVYVSGDSSATVPIYVATNPLPPQY